MKGWDLARCNLRILTTSVLAIVTLSSQLHKLYFLHVTLTEGRVQH